MTVAPASLLPSDELRRAAVLLAAGGSAVFVVAIMLLPWPAAAAATALGALMIVGADVDARMYLIPDFVTLGAAVCGIIAAPLLDTADPSLAICGAIVRAAGTAIALGLVRQIYLVVRARDGLGFGDVKLAAAVGAWLPLDAIPMCFCLATSAALVAVTAARLRGDAVDARTRIPFGTFLCPALWLMFCATAPMA